MNPAISQLTPYAFTQFRAKQDALAAQGVKITSFGVGDPEDETPEFIRQALVAALTPRGRYPTAAGLPELRQAIAGWLTRRFNVATDAERHVIPANGSKEALYNLAPLILDDPAARPSRQLIAVPELAYQVYADSAVLHHAEVLSLPLDPAWLPDLNAITPAVGQRLALLWLNFPNNPTGALAPLSYYQDVLDLAERYGFYVGSDEAYSELWYVTPPPSLLQASESRGYERTLAINTLSKRSNMTAYRSGFIAGDPGLIAMMKNVRPRIGAATPEFIQRAAIAAWNDETHVEQQRARYAERRALFLGLFERKGIALEASQAAFYLWVRAPGGDGDLFTDRLLEHGVYVLPGSFFGPRGKPFVRFAFVPSLELCRQAVEVLERVL